MPASAPTETPCADGGDGACYRVALAGTLPPSTSCAVSIAAGAVDADGAAVAAGTIGVFEDADAPDVTAPVLSGVAAAAAGPCLDVSFATDEPASGTIVVQAGGVEIDTPAGAGDDQLRRRHSAGSAATVGGGDRHRQRRPISPATRRSLRRSPSRRRSRCRRSPSPRCWPIPPARSRSRSTSSCATWATPRCRSAGCGCRTAKAATICRPRRWRRAATRWSSPPPTIPTRGAIPRRAPGRCSCGSTRGWDSDGLSNSGEAVQLVMGDAVVSSYGGWVSVSAGSWNGKAVHRLVQTACDSSDAWNHTPLPPTPGSGSALSGLRSGRLRRSSLAVTVAASQDGRRWSTSTPTSPASATRDHARRRWRRCTRSRRRTRRRSRSRTWTCCSGARSSSARRPSSTSWSGGGGAATASSRTASFCRCWRRWGSASSLAARGSGSIAPAPRRRRARTCSCRWRSTARAG